MATNNAIDTSTNFITTATEGWNGSIIETAAVTVTSDGATITFSVQKSGGGNLTVVFSDGFFDWVTAPDTVALTAGSDTSPQINYVYFLQSTKLLTVSTSAFPTAEHAPLATVLCQTAASLQPDGPYKLHAWTDHVVDASNNGHIAHLNKWIRSQQATWETGVAPTLTITPNGGAADNVIFTSASGVVLQLHDHTFPAFSGTPDVYTVNDSATAFNVVTDLNALLTDSTGASMSGMFFSLVIWGVVSEDGATNSKLMVNLPGGSYNNQNNLIADASEFATFTIPSDFTGTGFLIAELQLRHQAAASGTWTEIDVIDLRGQFPQRGAGGATVGQVEFPDNVFRILDDSDATKEIAFQASGITTATTRTMTVQDASGTIAYLADLFAWNEETGTTLAMLVDNGYIMNNAGLVTGTLPTTAAVGSVIKVVGKGAGGWLIAQNAGESIRWDEATVTTTGVGGSLASSDDHDFIEIVCTTADTVWTVMAVKGNITIV